MEEMLARVTAGEADPALSGLRRDRTSDDDPVRGEPRPGCHRRGRGGGVGLRRLPHRRHVARASTRPPGLLPLALRSGARAVIVNAEETEYDHYAWAVIRERIESVLPQAAEQPARRRRRSLTGAVTAMSGSTGDVSSPVVSRSTRRRSRNSRCAPSL
jgi:hypothetical protein